MTNELRQAWRTDRALRGIVLAAVVLRLAALVALMGKPCLRDECTYQLLVDAILDGRGMVGSGGWLWAPAYPFLLAAHTSVTGLATSVQLTQVAAAAFGVVAVYALARRVAVDHPRTEIVARVAAGLYALDPTAIFFSASLWSEALYTPLLLALLLAVARAREDKDLLGRGVLVGVLLGASVLFRGVALTLLPAVLVGLLLGRWTKEARGQVLAALLSATLIVAPYSVWASQRFGGLVVSDRTLGQMMWLGNNDFPPVTFDHGVGLRTEAELEALEHVGRPHCPTPKRPARQDDCEVAHGKAWIAAHPGEFLRRVPLRVAQLVNPHSFLTRHLRQAEHGFPAALVEALVVTVVAFSAVSLLGGTLGYVAWAEPWRARAAGRAEAASIGLVVLAHVAAIAALAGLSRYRVPLVPAWSIFAAMLCVTPRETVSRVLDGHPARWVGLAMLAGLAGMMACMLPWGWIA